MEFFKAEHIQRNSANSDVQKSSTKNSNSTEKNISTATETITTQNWAVPEDLFYFDGHFPQNPVLPAVAIVDLSLAFLQKAHPELKMDLLSVIRAKFSQPLKPLSKILICAKPVEVDSANIWDLEWKIAETLDVAAELRLTVLLL